MQPIESPADWRGDEMTQRTDWIHVLAAEEVDEIERALAAVRERAIDIADVTRENFPLPRFARIAEKALGYLEDGPGMFLVRGLPVDRHPVDDMRLVYWALGKYLGTAVCQSQKGDVLGDVRDLLGSSTGLGRGYQSRDLIDFHGDTCDVVGLLVLRTAKRGGLSKIASWVAVHNEMLRRRPDLVEALYRPFKLYAPDWGEAPWEQTMFSVHEGKFACCTNARFIKAAQERFPELPRLSPLQLEALDMVKQIPKEPGFHFTMAFQPGDLQLLNNLVTTHARTGFEDYEEPDRKRHLLRLWLAPSNSRALSPPAAQLLRNGRAGAVRGGYSSKSGKIVFESLVE